MKYVVMCGGKYENFRKPKQLQKVNGETLIGRTMRLLKENGVEAYITATDERFKQYGEVLVHDNPFRTKDDIALEGYWLDAFYPDFPPDTEVTYLFGDVYFSEKAIREILQANVTENTLVGNSVAKNEEHQNWGEPFAYIVKDYKTFLEGIKKTKKLYDDGKLVRHPIVWELYRVLNHLDPNVQQIVDRTYITIDDETIDYD